MSFRLALPRFDAKISSPENNLALSRLHTIVYKCIQTHSNTYKNTYKRIPYKSVSSITTTRIGVCFRREVGVSSHENRKTYRHPETPSGDLLPGKTPREVAGSFWCLVGTKWEVLILALLTTPRQVGGTWWELGGEHFCLGKSEAEK